MRLFVKLIILLDLPIATRRQVVFVRFCIVPGDSEHAGELVDIVERVEQLRAVQRESLRQAEHLFFSLVERAFKR